MNAEQVGKEFVAIARNELLEVYYPRIVRCVNELTDDDIWWRAHPARPDGQSGGETNNSIGNLILHLSGNVRQWIVTGIGGAPDVRNRPLEFAERTHIPKGKLLNKLHATLEEADEVLAKFDLSKLLEVRHIQKYDVTCLEAIFHVVSHFSTHTGQIIYITKLRKGVDLKFYDL
ncbi:MAG: DUF1572 family protein [Bacteroidota bacterium]